MTLYAAIFNETDNCTYWCDQWLGVFDDRSKADEFILRQLESKAYSWRDIKDYEVREIEVNVPFE